MALALGPVIGTVGGATWDETPVSATAVSRLSFSTLMTLTPPSAGSLVVVIVGDVQVPSSASATLWIGDHYEPAPAGRNMISHITASGGAVRFQGNNAFGATSSFVGSVYTIPFPE